MLPVLIAFAGVLIAAAATGMLAGRCARGPGLCFETWTIAALGLMIALAAAGVGLATGFGPATFRAIEIGGQLIAPLWLTWGLIEFVASSAAVRFGARLIYGFALTVVVGLILATGSLGTAAFSKAWPEDGQHYQPVSQYALLLAQAAAITGTLAAAGMARRQSRRAPVMAGVGALGLAVVLTVALRFSLPAGSAYPLMAALAAGLIWFGVTRGLGTVDDSWRLVGRGDRSQRSSRFRRDGRDQQDQQDPLDTRDSRDVRGARDQQDEAARYGRHGQRPDTRGYEQQRYEPDPYRQDPYRPDEYGRSQYGQGGRYSSQRYEDQHAPDPYGENRYGQDPRGPGEYSQGEYGHSQSQYSQSQYGRGPYGQDQYAHDQYGDEQDSHGQDSRAADSYGRGSQVPDPYGQGAHARDSYGQRSYVPDPYGQGSHAPDPYGQSSYAPDPRGQSSYAPDPYGQSSYAPDPYGQGSPAPDPYAYGSHASDSYGQNSPSPDPYGSASPGPGSYVPDPYGPDPYGPDSFGQGTPGPDRYGADQRGMDSYGRASAGQGGYGRDNGYQRDADGHSRNGRYESNGRNARYESSGRTGGYESSGRGVPRAAGQGATGPRVTGQGATGAGLAGAGLTGAGLTGAGPGAPLGQDEPAAAAEDAFGPETTAGSPGAQSRPYGRIQIFTLLDDKAVDFDKLAEQTAEEVRIGEPDTLVYVIHLVPNAPMQRIFYEIYRDRAAFDSHENKSYTKRFVAERRSYVLATNVIELRLKYAKVAPLPVDSRQLEPGRAARAQLPPGPTGTASRPEAVTSRYDTATPRYDTAAVRPAATAPRQAGGNGQWAQPPADPRYGRV
jgi:quinol monooxygenase YgiN